MRLIALRDAVKSYGSRTVLRGLDLEVRRARPDRRDRPERPRARATLLRILAGLDEPDSAPAVRRRGMVASDLPQLVGPDPRTPIEICHAARPDIARVEHELEECAIRIGSPEAAADMGRDAAGDQPRSGRPGNTTSSAATPSTGNGARAPPDARPDRRRGRKRPHAELSGGKRKLVALAACLARRRTYCCSTSPRHISMPVRRERLEQLVRSSTARSSWSPTTATCWTRRSPRSPSWIAARPDVARQLLGVRASARARAQASSNLRRPAEGDRAPRGGDPALQAVGAHVENERHRPRTRSARSSGWTRSTGPCWSGAGSGWRCGARARRQEGRWSCVT